MLIGRKCNFRAVLMTVCCSSLFVIFAQASSFGQTAIGEVQDIALLKGQYLVGMVKQDAQTALKGQKIELVNFKGDRLEAATDDQGRFMFKGLSSGSHTLFIGSKAFPVRMWSEGIAPRSAKQYFSYTAQPAVRTVQFTQSSAQPNAQPSTMIVRGQSPYCDECKGPCSGSCDACDSMGGKRRFGGLLGHGGLTPGGAVVGATAIGLGVWGIVELADDDDSAS